MLSLFYRSHLEGNEAKTLVDRRVINTKFFDGNIYYTAVKGNVTGTRLGKLYKYNIFSGQETVLSDKSVSEFYAGKVWVYFKAEGYNSGLYEVTAKGKSLCLVNDTIDDLLYTDTGMVYTLRYAEGVYST